MTKTTYWAGALALALAAFCDPIARGWQEANPEPANPTRYVNANWSFEDSDLSTLTRRMKWVGIELPFKLSGKATTRIAVGVPFGALADAKKYRLTGTIQAARLTVDETELHNVSARIRYADGVLNLEQLRFTTSADQKSAGAFVGSARMELIPRGNLTIDAQLHAVPVTWLAKVAAPDLPVDRGKLSGRLTASAPVGKLRQTAAWTGAGELHLSNVQTLSVVLRSGMSQFRLANNQLLLTHLQADPGGGVLTGTGSLSLAAPYLYAAKVQWQNVAAVKLLALDSKARPVGRTDGNLALTGSLQTSEYQAAGDIRLNELKWNAVTVPPLNLQLVYDAKEGHFLTLNGDVESGSLTGRLVPQADVFRLTLDFKDAPLRSFWSAAEGGSLNGRAELAVPRRNPLDVESWTGSAETLVLNAAASGWTISSLNATAGLKAGVAVVHSLTASLADDDLLSLKGQVSLSAPYSFELTGDLPSTDLSVVRRLAPRLEWPEDLSGTLQGRTNFRGALESLQLDGVAQLLLNKANVAGVPVDQATMEVTSEKRTLRLSKLSAQVAKGTVTGEGRLPLDAGEPAVFDLNFQDVRLESGPWRQVRGGVGGRVHVTATTPRLWNASDWTGDADLELEDVVANRLSLPRLNLSGRIADGFFDSDLLKADLRGFADLQGKTRVSLASPFKVAGVLNLVNGDLGKLKNVLQGDAPASLQGLFSITGKLAGTLAGGDLALTGNADGRDVGVGEASVETLTAAYHVNAQQASLERFEIPLWNGSIVGKATLPFASDSRLAATAKAAGVDLANLGVEELAGTAAGDVTVSAPVASLSEVNAWNAQFQVTLTKRKSSVEADETLTLLGVLKKANLHVNAAGVPWVKTVAARAHVVAGESKLKLDPLHVQTLQGDFRGDAVYPFSPDQQTVVRLKWSNVDPLQATPTLRLRAASQGELAATYHRPSGESDARFDLQGQFEIPKLLRGQAAIGSEFIGQFHLRNDAIDYRIQGNMLGGNVHWDGRWDCDADENLPRSSFRIESVSLERAGSLFQQPFPLNGTANVSLDYRHEPDGTVATGSGQLILTDVHYHQRSLIPEMRGRLAYRNGAFELQDFAGRLTSGQVRFSARTAKGRPTQGNFALSMSGVQTSSLAPIVPAVRTLENELAGTVDVELRGGFGRRVQAGGVIELARGSLHAIPVTNVRMPVQLHWDLASNTGEVRISGANGQMIRGRAAGDIVLTWSPRLVVKSDLRLIDLDVWQVLSVLSESANMGTGRMSGKITLSGRDVSGLRDLSGNVRLSIRDAQSAQFSVVRSLQPYLPPAAGGLRFDEGDLAGNINNGVLHIEKLTLQGRGVQLFVTGDVAASGRLGLNVTASTGKLAANRTLFEELFLKLPTVGAPPVALLLQANEYLSDRVIHLEVTGTLRQPIVRPKALETLGEEAVRFFLKQATTVR